MKGYVYMIERKDYDHHTDRKGRLAAVSVHKTVESANEAAQKHMEQQMSKSDLGPEIYSEGPDKNGYFACFIQTFEDGSRPRDNFKLQVKRMELQGVSKQGAPSRRAGNENTASNRAVGEVVVVD